jgi:hypothetical protein
VVDRSRDAKFGEAHLATTGLGDEATEPCEDVPFHISGAVQGYGLLIVFDATAKRDVYPIRFVSENSERIVGRRPTELFALDSLTDIFPKDHADDLIDNINSVMTNNVDVVTNGPEVFPLSLQVGQGHTRKLWCAVHQSSANSDLTSPARKRETPLSEMDSPSSVRGGRAIRVTSWVWAMAVSTLGFVRTVVPLEPLVSICAVPTVSTAGYSSAVGGIAVLLAAWVVSLYSRVFVNLFRELASAKEPERADWLLV